MSRAMSPTRPRRTLCARWRQHAGLNAWLMKGRLNGIAVMSRHVKPDDSVRMALLQQLGAKSGPAAAKLQVLLASAT